MPGKWNNRTAKLYADESLYRKVDADDVRLVWECRGCGTTITTSVDVHLHGTPFCSECNGHFYPLRVETKKGK